MAAADAALKDHWDWARSEKLLHHAIASNPGDADARIALAWQYVNSGTPDKAWPELSSLLATGSVPAGRRADIGWLLLRMKRPDLAVLMCAWDNVTTPNLLSCRHTAFARLDRPVEARRAAGAIMALTDAEPRAIAAVLSAPLRRGYQRFLEWRAQSFRPRSGEWFQLAQIEAEAGRLDAAMRHLDRSFRAHEPSMVKLASTVEFGPLSSRPEYQHWLAAIRSKAVTA